MKIENVPFTTIDWATVAPTEEPGATGTALTRTVEMGNVRVRLVEFSPGYLAADWCSRGHAVLILEGELETQVKDGASYRQGPGTGVLVADGAAPHRSSTATGAKVFIVD
jgi:quercetin dioxygenase-like cupin family protein